MSKRISRRSLLLSLLSTAGTSALTGSEALAASILQACRPTYPKEPAFAELAKNTPIVDIHCHIFNATDLPAYQFFQHVVSLHKVFEAYLAKNSKQTIYQLRNGEWNRFYEARKGYFDGILRQIRTYEGFINAYPLDRLLLTPSYHPERALLDSLLKDPLQSLDGIEKRLISATAKDVTTQESSNYLMHWFRYLSIDWRSIRKITKNDIDVAASKMRSRNLKFQSSNTQLDSGLRFARNMCMTRTENFLRLRSEYSINGSKRNELRLFTPALVDFDYWLDGPQARKAPETAPSFLNSKRVEGIPKEHILRHFDRVVSIDRPRTTLAEQMELMGKLSELYPGECHAYFPFCPWRQVDKTLTGKADEAPLTLLKKAVEDHGFIGVKLYPPMGFRPLNNAKIEVSPKITKHMFPDHLYEKGRFSDAVPRNPGEKDIDWKFRVSAAFGAELDKALDELYAYCVASNVPIMTHAAPSNFCGGYDYVDGPDLKHNFYSEKAAIAYWQAVIKKPEYQSLRLNLGHSGFRNEEWNKQLAEILKTSVNVYADLSYFEEILGGPTSQTACTDAEKAAEALRAGFKKHDGIWRRFMYGSDWYMMTQERFSANYLDNFARLVYERVAEQGDRASKYKALMAGNASRFLGLDLKTGPSNYTRLEAFFAKKFGKPSKRYEDAIGRLDKLALIAGEN